MHDPMTLLWDVYLPRIRNRHKKYGHGLELFDIWHIDPETDGTDSSCRHAYENRQLNPREKALAEAIWKYESVFGNRPFYEAEPGSDYDRAREAFYTIRGLSREWRKRTGFRIHPDWHVHHWRVRFMPYIEMQRALTRCYECGKWMGWRAPAIGRGWDDPGRAHAYHRYPKKTT